jgi:hypothetical protein
MAALHSIECVSLSLSEHRFSNNARHLLFRQEPLHENILNKRNKLFRKENGDHLSFSCISCACEILSREE